MAPLTKKGKIFTENSSSFNFLLKYNSMKYLPIILLSIFGVLFNTEDNTTIFKVLVWFIHIAYLIIDVNVDDFTMSFNKNFMAFSVLAHYLILLVCFLKWDILPLAYHPHSSAWSPPLCTSPLHALYSQTVKRVAPLVWLNFSFHC